MNRSKMECSWFTSNYTRDELDEAYEKFVDKYLPREIQCWEFEEENGEFRPKGAGSWIKGMDHEELAKFISLVINTDGPVYMNIEPEDGEPWGYVITSGRVAEARITAGRQIYSAPVADCIEYYKE